MLFRSHPSLNAYYQPNLTILNEREILTDLEEIIIPDRIVVNAQNQATIIDYKTGKELAEHQKQINKYAYYVQQMGITVVTKILVYINEEITIKEVN